MLLQKSGSDGPLKAQSITQRNAKRNANKNAKKQLKKKKATKRAVNRAMKKAGWSQMVKECHCRRLCQCHPSKNDRLIGS